MVVIIIVGILSAVALPKFLGVKDKAKVNVQIGEGAGLAKECAAAILSEGPYPANYASLTTASGLTIGGHCNTGGDISKAPATTRTDLHYTTQAAKGTEGAKCPRIASVLASGKACKINVDANSGEISYAVVP